MVTPPTIPIFINERPVAALPGQSLGDVLSVHAPELFAALLDGQGKATDGRGIAVTAGDPVHAGAIYRVFASARREGPIDA